MIPLAVITYLWQPDQRSHLAAPYTADDVRRLQRAVSRNLTLAHKFVCVTDRPELFADDEDIEAIPIDAAIPMDAGHCACRLMTFRPDAAEIFRAERVFQMDIDTFVIDLMNSLVKRPEDIVLWRNPARVPWNRPTSPRPYYNGSFVLHRCGSMGWIWESYRQALRQNPALPALRDDQSWLSCAFGPNAPYWDGARDGVYRIARPGEPETGVWGDLPDNAVLVTCPGSEGKPDNPMIRAANPWIADMWAPKRMSP